MLVISPSIRNLLTSHKRTLLAAVFIFLYSFSITLAVPPATKYQPGATLDPVCAPTDTNCSVQILPDQTSNANKYLTTDGSSTAWSSSTLVLGGNFTTSGAYATTLTATGTTTLTLPTSGTLATTANINAAVSGTLNYIPKFTGTNTIGNSIIFDDGTNVGVGTGSPGAKLEVIGTQGVINTTIRQLGVVNIYDDTTANVDVGAVLTLGGKYNSSGTYSAFGAIKSGKTVATDSWADGYLSFYTTANTGILSEKMRITSAGNVGIGTIAPAGKLHIQTSSTGVTPSTSASDLVVENNSNAGISILGGNTSSGYLVFGDNDSNATGIIQYFHSDPSLRIRALEASAYLTLSTNNTERFRIDSSGNLIIADLAGSGNRCVYADTNGQLGVKSDDCGLASGGDDMGDHTATQNIILGSNWLSGDGGNEGIKIDASGNVGVGVASPLATFNVNGSTEFGTGAWPTTSVGQSAGRVLISGTNEAILILNNPNNTIAADTASSIHIGARATTDGNDLAGVILTGARETATSGTFSSYFSIKTMNGTDGTQFERMRISANGNVGIGTASPNAPLHVFTETDTSSGYGSFMVGSSVSGEMRLSVGTNDAGGYTYIQSTESSTGHAILSLNPSGGNVGIGTTTPQNVLHLNGGSDGLGYLRITDSVTGATSSDGARIGYNGGALRIQNYENSAISFFTNTSTEAMTIVGSGNVGIGITSPLVPFHLSNASPSFYIDDTSTSGTLERFIIANGDVGSTQSAVFSFSNNDSGSTGSTAVMTINEAGRVGIGTTGPDSVSKLNISKAGKDALYIDDTTAFAAGVGGSIILRGNYRGLGDMVSGARIAAEKTNGTEGNYSYNLAFYTTNHAGSNPSTSPSLLINNEGNVGIGTTSPGAKLDVVGTSTFSGAIINTGGASALLFNAPTVTTGYKYMQIGNGTGGVLWGVEGTTVGSLATGSIANSSVFSTFTTTPLHFGINQVVKMTIDSSGNVGIGTTSPTTTGGSAGGSITLNSNSATSSAGVIIMANAASKSYVYWSSTYGMLLQNQNADKWTFYNGSGEAANISAVGAYSQVSDGRLKHSVTNLDDTILDRVLELRPVTYIFNNDDENTLQIGFIAQEVQALFPELVSVGADENHTLSLNYTGLIPYVVKGMQEMDITIQALPEFEDDGSMAQKVADFLRGIAERGEAIVDSIKTNNVDTENIQTDTLCVGEVCVSEDAFLQMVQNAGADSSSSGGGTPDPVPEETPPVEEPPAEEPSPTPEPEPDPLPEPNPEPQAPTE